uniref:Tafazzin family protein n=1 Tax=Glossina morsitans morsitans TaxID=37546 RepID=A0A1B0GBS5_GLOMM
MLAHIIMYRCIKVNNRMYLPELCGRRGMFFLVNYVKNQHHDCRFIKSSSSSIADKNQQYLDDCKKKKFHNKSLPEMHNHKIKNQEVKQRTKQLQETLTEKRVEEQATLPSLPQHTLPSSSNPSPPTTPSTPSIPPTHIPYDIDWIFPRMLRPSGFWYVVSQITIFAVGLFSKIVLGKCIPIIRGSGVHQSAVDLCIQKLKLGEWVHVFPEGKVNMTKEEMRLKWGVGRIIYESPRVPIILPMWHEGMDNVLPNTEPYYLKFGKKVTLNVGKPIDLNDFIEDLKFRGVKEGVARKLITDRIQDVFRKLRLETEELHRNRFL